MYRKKKIPSSLRQMVWITYNGENFKSKCHVIWCKNIITPFTFEVGHNKPESKGGQTTIENLLPICSSCNRSMGNTYTITEYCERFSELNKNNIQTKQQTISTPIYTSIQTPTLTPIPIQNSNIKRRSLLNIFMKPFRCFRF